jgi:hypothetical protein
MASQQKSPRFEDLGDSKTFLCKSLIENERMVILEVRLEKSDNVV